MGRIRGVAAVAAGLHGHSAAGGAFFPMRAMANWGANRHHQGCGNTRGVSNHFCDTLLEISPAVWSSGSRFVRVTEATVVISHSPGFH